MSIQPGPTSVERKIGGIAVDAARGYRPDAGHSIQVGSSTPIAGYVGQISRLHNFRVEQMMLQCLGVKTLQNELLISKMTN